MLRLRTGTVCSSAVLRRSVWRLIPNRLLGAGHELGDQAEPSQTRVERAAAETERSGSVGLVALRSPQSREDRLLLDLGQRLRQRRWALSCNRSGGDIGRGRRVCNNPQVASGDELSIGEDQRALDGVLQFPDVARPIV